jgi:hypothetical protein
MEGIKAVGPVRFSLAYLEAGSWHLKSAAKSCGA